ncbi:PKD domain-containing protein [Intrasporangium calvum]|nr:PKD domain-containing protein [Intrasporangium calvum]
MLEPQPHWKYRLGLSGCDSDGGPALSGHCLAAATAACAGNSPEQGLGPLSDVYRWWVDEDGDPLPADEWPAGSEPAGPLEQQLVGTTCLPNRVPGVSPVPTVEMIIAAFHETRWATAAVKTQPEGDTTLVNLETFYRLSWSREGFEPDEVDTVDPATMYGYRVQIRPRLVGYVYEFGDGASFGPTDSPGGTYPHGEVTHTYREPGRYRARVLVTFGAQFRVNGGPWIEVPDEVTVAQPATTVTVKEARAVLVNR